MGAVFEELIRKFAELSNETAGEHFTPREVIRLMVNLLFIEDDAALTKPGVVRSLYDPTAGTGGMLSVAGEHLNSLNPQAQLVMYGQELNPESYAICKADMLIKGQDIANIIFGNTLAYLRLYTFLSQIFDYGNTGIEKRALFYKRLLPLLEFGREREGIDLTRVVLTHHHLKDHGSRPLPLATGEAPKLDPIREAGSGSVQEQQKVYMGELIAKLNDLLVTETSEQDQLRFVNGTLLGKVAESLTLQQQAADNSRKQFAHSPNLKTELQSAIIDSLDAHHAMSSKALNSPLVMDGLLDILLNHAGLYETLRSHSSVARYAP